ncbi:putative Retron Ec83 ATPase [Vibrio crassostreae]|uniref:retron Ec78 anti-phage system effector ATPase PtuA n=1 Tax=Vibrio crassostreae TaxID=246167 RepID=UPI001B30B0F0|nr:retron Ec78 anti-phage system effector ATPase PtuA [Vibrio crassostreae]CAK2028714.1 putative Retron Ec83 ATPase [Vibrio crassostreae]CAK2032460.1 putative Retron Ec83 ATPase [Vibrio crassostreae]CAK2033203.1 putative Retron Ec83 ATPase [Vibrio crassostreae]CAK2034457.1 putative Retron Ec83 ATPase [Vibrio crassostreae]CAK2036778.1 putative Retron Ec83 ATPase [Vibrio crassostreae]
MPSQPNRQINKIILKSESGSFAASAQLVQVYSEGMMGAPVDLEKVHYYRIRCAEQLTNANLKLASLKLIGYRGFESLEIPFSQKSNVTVLVGNNGSGKSSVLDAIQKSLTHFVSRLSTRSYNGDQLDEFDISNEATFTTVIPEFKVAETSFSFELSLSRPMTEPRKKSKFSELNEIGNVYRLANTGKKELSLPLLASYTVERANDVTTKDIEESDEILSTQTWDKSKAYSKCLTGKADFKLFFRWFKEQVEAENDESSDIKVIKAQIESKESEINSSLMKSILSNPETTKTGEVLIKQYQEQINELQEQLNEKSNVGNKSLDSVRNAIYKFLPGFSDLKLKRAPLDMVVKKDDQDFSVLQLSQGEKSVLALVADIARRLTMLNPSLANPLEGNGLVLIDEVDLHLHPSWQQKIMQRLESTFPNLQFIVTTHSPQVCHTLDSDNIWLLKGGKKFSAPKGVRGAVSSWVLKKLFYVEERPPEDEITQIFNKYKKLVYADQYDSADALTAREKLIDNFGKTYDEIVELDLYIENKEWEKEFEED